MSTEPARPSVLVVDDELEMAEMLADGLIDRGYDAKPIASSERAAAMLQTQPFDALVTDLRMPKVDGLALLGRLLVLTDPRGPVRGSPPPFPPVAQGLVVDDVAVLGELAQVVVQAIGGPSEARREFGDAERRAERLERVNDLDARR